MSDSETIARRRAEFVAALNRQDISLLSDIRAQNSIDMPPNRPAIRGLNAIQAYWREGFAQTETRFTVFPEQLEIDGATAVDRFRWSAESAPLSGGDVVHDEGISVWTWRRQEDGAWKLALAIWNSDLAQGQTVWTGAGTAASVGSTLAADDREILKTMIEDEWTAACLARDWDKTLAMCAEDIVYMPADLPALRGHAELRSWLENFPRILKFAQPLEELEGDARLAVARATFSGAIEAEGEGLAFA